MRVILQLLVIICRERCSHYYVVFVVKIS